METVGHSRLLKFLVDEEHLNKMASPTKHKIEFEYIQPTSIESEVPGQQNLREVGMENADEDASQDSLLFVDDKDEVYSPVITVTTQEAAYTKGELKLQKITVVENISDEDINGGIYYINPNPNIICEVVKTQPVRVIDRYDDVTDGNDLVKVDDEKPKSRIPMMKDRRNSEEKYEPPPPIRLTQKRSSIPRLQRRPSKPTQEDEFDKLYDEIVNEPEIIENIPIKDDPIKLENKFDEIVHDYEDNIVQPIIIDRKTKIPNLRRRSDDIPKASVKKDKNETRIPVNNARVKSVAKNEKQANVDGVTSLPKTEKPHSNIETVGTHKIWSKIPHPKAGDVSRHQINEGVSTHKIGSKIPHPKSDAHKSKLPHPRSQIEHKIVSKIPNVDTAKTESKIPLKAEAKTDRTLKPDPVKVISPAEFNRKITSNIIKSNRTENIENKPQIGNVGKKEEVLVKEPNLNNEFTIVKPDSPIIEVAKDYQKLTIETAEVTNIAPVSSMDEFDWKNNEIETNLIKEVHNVEISDLRQPEHTVTGDYVIEDSVNVIEEVTSENNINDDKDYSPAPDSSKDEIVWKNNEIETNLIKEVHNVEISDLRQPEHTVTGDYVIEDSVNVIEEVTSENNINDDKDYSPAPDSSMDEFDWKNNEIETNLIKEVHNVEISDLRQPEHTVTGDYVIEDSVNVIEEVTPENNINDDKDYSPAPDSSKDEIVWKNNEIETNLIKEVHNVEISDLRQPEHAITGDYVIEDSVNVIEEVTPENNINDDKDYSPGKVSRLLQRIQSQEFGANNEPRKKEIEIPKKRSVLSKIAMFENSDTRKPSPQHKPPPLPKEEPKVVDRRPIIVHELLKSAEEIQPNIANKIDNSLNDTKEYTVQIVDESVKYHEIHVVNEIQPETHAILDETPNTSEFELESSLNKAEIATHNILDDYEEYTQMPNEIPVNRDTNEFELESIENTAEITTPNIIDDYEEYAQIATNKFKPENNLNKSEISKSYFVDNKYEDASKFEPEINGHKAEFKIIDIDYESPVGDSNGGFDFKLNGNIKNENDEVFSDRGKSRLKSRQESKKDRPKSVAEMDLGNIVKGRVHQLIERMNSVEIIEVHKKGIEDRERPRKKSVSNIIALFEIASESCQKTFLDPRYHVIEQKSTVTQRTIVKPETTTRSTTQPPGLTDEEYELRKTELLNATLNYGRIENMTYMLLANGREMPVLALGTALLDQRLIKYIIGAAIDMGYRAIDTAFIYGNEKEVGEAINAKINDKTVEREDLFILSKLWSTYHRSDLVAEACNRSLVTMGLKYFDLYMIHNPMSFKEGSDPLPKIANVIQYSEYDYVDAWYGMETVYSKGMARSIGLSNFNSTQVQRVLDKSKIKPVINQVECHPYLSQQKLDEYCTAREVKLSCFGVLGSKGTPIELKSSLPPVIDDPLVKVMAAGLNISVAQLLIRYQIDSGRNAVVKASTAAHLWDNLQALHISLNRAQLDALNALNRSKRTFTFVGMGDTHKNYPFKTQF